MGKASDTSAVHRQQHLSKSNVAAAAEWRDETCAFKNIEVTQAVLLHIDSMEKTQTCPCIKEINHLGCQSVYCLQIARISSLLGIGRALQLVCSARPQSIILHPRTTEQKAVCSEVSDRITEPKRLWSVPRRKRWKDKPAEGREEHLHNRF